MHLLNTVLLIVAALGLLLVGLISVLDDLLSRGPQEGVRLPEHARPSWRRAPITTR